MQFYYAYVSSGSVAFNAAVHNERDERVYAVEYAHNEGEFATLTLRMRNPRVGLLNAERMQWLWFSVGEGEGEEETITPLFYGRLVALPENLHDETVTLVFRSEPEDFEEQKASLAQSLKEFPYYDPIWLDPDKREDPDTIVQVRPVRWHIDPVTHDVTVSHITAGEDGSVSIGVGDEYYGTLNFTYNGHPLSHVRVEAEVDWEQVARGAVDLKRNLLLAFQEAGSADGLVTSFTGQGLENDWPETGDRIGGGWAFGLSYAGEPKGASARPPEDEKVPLSRYKVPAKARQRKAIRRLVNQARKGEGVLTDIVIPDAARPSEYQVYFSLWKFNPLFFEVSYDARRKRSETLAFDLFADVQTLSVDAEKTETMNFNSSAVAEEIDEELPIGNPSRRSYFSTDRGKRSLEYLIAAASTRLLYTARAAEISVRVPFSKWKDLSLRKSAVVTDHRLPGGSAGGKIIARAFSLSGGDGSLNASVRIGGTIGKGDMLGSPASGTPDYVEEGHYEPGYQQYVGAEIEAIPNQVHYADYVAQPDDDGIDFSDMRPETVIVGSRAEATLTMKRLPVADETVSIGSVTYTWKAAAGDPYTLRIGYTVEDSIVNLVAAVNAIEDFAGLRYGADTEANPHVSARVEDPPNKMRVIAVEPGEDANIVSLAASTEGVDWSSPTLEGGAPSPAGFQVVNGESAQRSVLGEVYEDTKAAEEALNEAHTRVKLELVNLVGGPFETPYEIDVSPLSVPKTVDLEAASLS